MKLFGNRFGGVKIALLSAVAVSAVGYVGYKVFFARTGEAAVALIPADATCVITLDSHPSESQIGTFTKLCNALKREGLDHDLEDGVSDAVGKAGIARDVRKYLTHNVASAFWRGSNGATVKGVVLLAINNPGAVSQIISTGSPVNGAGVPAYSFGKTGAVVAVVDDYLAISEDVSTISRVVATEHGAPSIATLPEYNSARSALPPDANLMVFASPAGISEMMGKGSSRTSMWMSFGASLRDGGIQFDYRGPVDDTNFPGLADLSNVPPLDPNLLRKLPPDAYGVVAYSSLDKVFGAARSSAGKITGDDNFKKGQADFEKETGLSVDEDILPAFKGDVALAIYPAANGSKSSADGVLLIDNAHGGKPAELADKVRAFIGRRTAKDAAKSGNPPMHFVQKQIGKVMVWTLDDASAVQMRKSLGSDEPHSRDGTMPDPMFEDKNVEYAVSNGSVLVATSPAMMANSILALNGNRSLAEDPAFVEMSNRIQPNDQFLIMCSLSRVAERFGDFFETNKESGFARNDIINLFGGPNTGLVGSCRVENDTISGTMFLPLDFDLMAKLIAGAKKGEGRPTGNSTQIRAARLGRTNLG